MKRSHKTAEKDAQPALSGSKVFKEDPEENCRSKKLDLSRSKKLDLLVEHISTLEKEVEGAVYLVGQLAECFTPNPRKSYSIQDAYQGNGVTILPLQPFTEIEEFLEFEEKLKNENLARNLSVEFCNTPSSGLRDFVAKCWRRVVVDSVARNFCWLGTNEKGCVRDMETTVAIMRAFRLKFPDVGISVFEIKTKQFFHHAKEREEQMEQRRNEKHYKENQVMFSL